MLHDLRIPSHRADAVIQLAALPSAASAGRRFVKAVLQIRGVSEFEDVASLCTSELVTNAVDATDGLVVLCIAITECQVRIEVWDTSLGMPTPRVARPGDVRGRGLVLVAATSDRWGSDPVADVHACGLCKVTWCEWDRVRDETDGSDATNFLYAIDQ